MIYNDQAEKDRGTEAGATKAPEPPPSTKADTCTQYSCIYLIVQLCYVEAIPVSAVINERFKVLVGVNAVEVVLGLQSRPIDRA